MKICIIGSGLTSLILAKNLIKKNLYVDIIYENYQKEPTSARTIGITNQNFQFLENLFPNLKSRSFSIKEIQIFNHNDLDSALLKFRSNNAGGTLGGISSGQEIITLNHEAFDRALYSDGAITAAKWLINKKPGLYSMRNLLNFK